MKKRWIALAMVWTLMGGIAACSSEQPIDLDAIEVKLATEPETVSAGTPLQLKVDVTGLTVTEDAMVTFDTRVDGEPKLFDLTHEGEGVFTGTYTFPEKGIQTVYLHFYLDDIHITEEKWIEVK
ncbi:hypothetical protein [Paenibacillus sp. PL2-23]|uniref:hypothetical protein n=1 Tax=Paenibacillus sp. PL2-23 TaxID=2100729 RepID=UPI0030F758B7